MSITKDVRIKKKCLFKFLIHKHTISRYVLYGSRNSGKSTLLKSILRLEPIDMGYIEIFGQSRRKKLKIGFMPQSDGLYLEFTVLEMIYYFAKFLNISKIEVEMVGLGSHNNLKFKLTKKINYRNYN